jgi:hypothetical protein
MAEVEKRIAETAWKHIVDSDEFFAIQNRGSGICGKIETRLKPHSITFTSMSKHA